MVWRELELGAIRIHILHHASEAPVFGAWLIEELARHGYSLGYGTLYPLLHRLEEDGLLVREERVESGHVRKYYTATERGRAELARARRLIAELHGEVVAGADVSLAPAERPAPSVGDETGATR